VAATAVVTVGGTVAAGNTASVTFTSPALSAPVTVTYTALSGDTIQSVAEGLASEINQNTTLGFYDVIATTEYDTVADEAKVVVNWPGPLGNLCVLSEAVTGSVTLTLSNSGVLSGGAGPVIPLNTFSVRLGGSATWFYQDTPFQTLTNDLAQLVAALPKPVQLK
jgi:hypothetical protein